MGCVFLPRSTHWSSHWDSHIVDLGAMRKSHWKGLWRQGCSDGMREESDQARGSAVGQERRGAAVRGMVWSWARGSHELLTAPGFNTKPPPPVVQQLQMVKSNLTSNRNPNLGLSWLVSLNNRGGRPRLEAATRLACRMRNQAVVMLRILKNRKGILTNQSEWRPMT